MAAMTAGVASPSEHDREQERIAAERAAAMARFAEREKVCNQQFVVTPCLNAAHQEQRTTLSRLQRQELHLADTRRREAAAQRVRELAEKSSARPERPTAPSRPEPDHLRKLPEPNPPAARRSGKGLDEPAANPGEALLTRRSNEARNQARYDEKQRAAQAHRDAVEHRNAQRAANPKVAPLPVPSAASGASTPLSAPLRPVP